MSNTKPKTRKYELMLILPNDRSTDERAEIIETVKGEISKAKGDIHHFDEWPIRTFCYPINKYTEGYYFILNFTLDADKINAFDKFLRLNTDILRHVVLLEPEQNYHYFNYEEDKAFYLGEGELLKTSRKDAEVSEEAEEEEKEEPKEAKKATHSTKKKVVEEKTEEEKKEPVEEDKPVEKAEEPSEKDETPEPKEEKEVAKDDKEENATKEEKTEPKKEEKPKAKEEKKPSKADKDKLDEERLKELDAKLDQLLLDD